MKSTLIGCALLVAAITLGPDAQAHPKHKIDANGDGVVDFNELQAMHPELTPEEFSKMDANSDGQLAREEMSAAHFEKRIERADSDGDGALSFEEMEAIHRHPGPEQFKHFDTDGDGKLTREELGAMHEEMRQHMPALMKFRHAPDKEETAPAE